VPVLEDSENHVILDDVQHTAFNTVEPDQDTSTNVFFASSITWAEENPETLEAFRDALQANADEVKASWLEIDSATLDAVPLPAISATIDAAMIQPLIDIQIEQGTLAEDDAPDLEKHVTPFE
jgi:hypothetical protein